MLLRPLQSICVVLGAHPSSSRLAGVDNAEEILLQNKESLVKHSTAVLRKIVSEEKVAVMPREIR